jgi:hypothetical protein
MHKILFVLLLLQQSTTPTSMHCSRKSLVLRAPVEVAVTVTTAAELQAASRWAGDSCAGCSRDVCRQLCLEAQGDENGGEGVGSVWAGTAQSLPIPSWLQLTGFLASVGLRRGVT